MTSERTIGKPLDRVDGRLKVTGAARYAAETQLANMAQAVLVLSTIAKGTIVAMDTAAAEKVPGVLTVLTHKNVPRMPMREEVKGTPDPQVGRPLWPLQDDIMRHNGQPVAVVVADTLDRALQAASLVRVSYREEKAVTEFALAAARAFRPTEERGPERNATKPAEFQRGDPEQALARAAVRIEQTYTIPAEHHNPMEPHATVAVWDGPKLTLYDKTQGVDMVQAQASQALGIPKEDIRVISPFVGGAFGSALRAWPHVFLAALAARQVDRPVKLVLTRSQMFPVTGYRPQTLQKVALGANRDGMLQAIVHHATGQTSTYEEYTETVLNPSRYLYACPNVATHYRLAAMNVNTPTPMRGTGEASGAYALECALDELAVALQLDPLELHCAITPTPIPKSSCPGRARGSRNVINRQPSASAGPAGIPGRVRCVLATCSWVTAWRRQPGRRTGKKRLPACASWPMAAPSCRALPAISARAPTRQ